MKTISVEDVIRTARAQDGKTLVTIGGGAEFTVRVEVDRPVFTPVSTGMSRPATDRKGLEYVVDHFNRSGSLKTTEYAESGSQNLSYILRLVAMAAGE